MKATAETPNTLFMALWSEGRGHALLGTLTTDGEPLRVMVDHDGDALTLLVRCLTDAQTIRARHLVLFTNNKFLLDLYTMPICLEPTKPGNAHLADERQWQVLRLFFGYESWQLRRQAHLPNAEAHWREIYG